MADVNVQAIHGNPPKLSDPLTLVTGWQDYANKIASGNQIRQQTENLKQTNRKGEVELGTTQANRNSQLMYGLLSGPDTSLEERANRTLDDQLATGQLEREKYEVMKKHLTENAGNVGAIKQTILQGFVGTLAGPEAMKALTPTITDTNLGDRQEARITPSPIQIQQGIPGGVYTGAGGVTRGLPAQVVDTGGQLGVMGGGAGTNPMNKSLTPGQATTIQDTWQQDANGNWVKRQETVGGANPALAPPSMRQGTGPLGAGGYGGAKPVDVPIETEKKIEQGQTAYTEDQKSVPGLQNGVTSLTKALHSLNTVATGKGTSLIQIAREYATSLANIAGVDIGLTGDQAADRAKIDKYLTEYARSGGTAGRSAEHLVAAMHANPSGEISNAAAQDVVRQLIGKDRQAIAAVQRSPGAQGHLDSKNKTVTTTDPRGFAWDQYTKAQQDEIVKKAKGNKGEDSEDFKKLMRAIAIANQQKMFATPPPANVNEN